MVGYSNKQIRDFLIQFFADDPDELEFFCDDYYPAVKSEFSEDMGLKRQAHQLTLAVAERATFDQLLNQLRAYAPEKFAEQTGLLGQPDPAGLSPGPKTGFAAESPAPAAATPETAEDPAALPSGQDVFISYSRKDENFVRQLYRELTYRGISAWYDRKHIGVATHWPTEIVEGIRDSRIFLIAISPDSTGSVNVRKEVDLALRYQKQIVPLIWRPAEIPVGMEYQLAGIQWIEFNETPSQQNFERLADVLRRLVGGSKTQKVGGATSMATAPAIPPPAAPAPAPMPGKQSFVLRKKQTVNPLALGGGIIAGVVTTFGLDTATQDFVNTELRWLFNAADNFLKIQQGVIPRRQPVAVPVPPSAECEPLASNRMLDVIDEFFLSVWTRRVEYGFKRIKHHLQNLDLLLVREAQMGLAGKADVELQNSIHLERLGIVEVLREIAYIMKDVYGVFVSSPDQLFDYLH